jgi:hypothetical protein
VKKTIFLTAGLVAFAMPAKATIIYQSIPDLTANGNATIICSQCEGDGQSAGQTVVLSSPSVAKSVTFSVVPYIPGSGFISGDWGWPVSVTIGIYQAGNGVVGKEVFNSTFTASQFISDTPTSNRTNLVTVDLGDGVSLAAGAYDVFLTNPTTLALSTYANLGSGGLIWVGPGTSATLTGDTVFSYLPITSTLLDTGLSISSTSAIPLPTTSTMVITGFGALGLLGWQKRRKQRSDHPQTVLETSGCA